MKHINKIIILLVLVSSYSLTAQNKDTKKADKLFAEFEFVKAIDAYNKLVEDGKADGYVYSQLADANYNIFNTAEAERWYAKALETESSADMMYNYAQMLKANGKTDKAMSQMAAFASKYPRDDRAKEFNANPNYLANLLGAKEKFSIEALDINTPESDFGGTLKDGMLYITSARNKSRRTYDYNEQPFLDIYALTENEDGTYGAADLLPRVINTKHHEGLVAFSPDGNTMYFSRESFFDNVYQKEKGSKLKYSVKHLYKAEKNEKGDWDNVQPLSINNQEYSVQHPTVNSDGTVLYFASDMPGGQGKYDIYKATINADGDVGAPENLGATVNTNGNEGFPNMSNANTLFFASDGHMGFGGLDVFAFDGNEVVNLGAPVNSNVDDFAFSLNEDTRKGFVSSNREGGQGSDDVYAITKLKPCFTTIEGMIVDAKTNTPLSGVIATLFGADGSKLDEKESGTDGVVTFKVDCETPVAINAVKEEYESNRVEIAPTTSESVAQTIALSPIEKIIVEDRVVLNPIYFDFDKWNIRSEAALELNKLVAVMKKYPDMVIKATSHTDSRGRDSYNLKLSDRRAKSTAQYVISQGIDASRISGIGKGESEPLIDCGNKCTEDEYQMNRRSEFIIVSGGPNNN